MRFCFALQKTEGTGWLWVALGTDCSPICMRYIPDGPAYRSGCRKSITTRGDSRRSIMMQGNINCGRRSSGSSTNSNNFVVLPCDMARSTGRGRRLFISRGNLVTGLYGRIIGSVIGNLINFVLPRLNWIDCWALAIGRDGGEGGIRTPDTLSSTHAFQACALNRSATSPFCKSVCDCRILSFAMQLFCEARWPNGEA